MMNKETALKLLTSGRTLIGQQLGNDPFQAVAAYPRYIGDLFSLTGKTPVILGAGYWGGTDADYRALNTLFRAHAEKGGLYTIYLRNLTNPWTGEKDHHTLRPEGARMIDLITEGTGAYYRWMTMLDIMVDCLSGIRDLVGLFRPFHECTYINGAWWDPHHWYESEYLREQDVADFKAVWRHWREYFDAAGLDNLIWVYSTANRTEPPASALYPGPEYAELCGPSVAGTAGLIADYNPPAPLVFGEARHRSSEPVSLIDYYLPWLEEHHPGYALFWSSYTDHPLALIDSLDVAEFMEHPLTVCLEDIPALLPEPENTNLELARLFREIADVYERAAK